MDTSILHSLTTWLHAHPNWGSFLVFLFSFLESLALVGLVFPGTVIMTAVGILVGSGILPFIPIILASTLGGFIGDYLSYGLGYYYRDNLKNIWPFKSFPKLLTKGENFFHTHGGKSIFIGRFIGPVRPLIPLIAGTLKMSYKRFLPVDFIACSLWAVAYLFPGFIIGAATLALPHDAAKRIIIDFGILLLISFIFYWLLKLSIVKITAFLDRIVFRFWHFLKRHPRWKFLHNFLKVSHIPDDHSQLGIALFAIIFWILLIVLTFSVWTHTGIYHINEPLYHFFRSAYALTMEKVMLNITYVGTPTNMGILWVVILGWLCWRRYWFTALHWASVGIIAAGAAEILKLFIASPRPTGIEIIPSGYSFPSGHTTMTAAILSFFAIIITADRDEYFAWFCFGSAAILTFLVGLSRIYLSAHWTTDVLAGFSLGLAISLSVAVSFRRYHQKQQRTIELFLIACLTLAVLWTGNYFYNFKKDIPAYRPVWSYLTMTETDWWKSGISNGPLYRKNRLGKNIQTLNIEWLGTLSDIQQELTAHGWETDPKSVLLHTISYFGTKNRTNTLPLFSAIYHDKKPHLLLTKIVATNNSLLILRLWESHVNIIQHITNPTKALWVGEISYIYTDKFRVFKKGKYIAAIQPKIPLALDVLINDLKSPQWKILHYPTIQRLNTLDDIDWDGRVLLIRNLHFMPRD